MKCIDCIFEKLGCYTFKPFNNPDKEKLCICEVGGTVIVEYDHDCRKFLSIEGAIEILKISRSAE